MKNSGTTLKYTSLGLVGAIALLIIWSFIEPRLLDTENETAQIPNLFGSIGNITVSHLPFKTVREPFDSYRSSMI